MSVVSRERSRYDLDFSAVERLPKCGYEVFLVCPNQDGFSALEEVPHLGGDLVDGNPLERPHQVEKGFSWLHEEVSGYHDRVHDLALFSLRVIYGHPDQLPFSGLHRGG